MLPIYVLKIVFIMMIIADVMGDSPALKHWYQETFGTSEGEQQTSASTLQPNSLGEIKELDQKISVSELRP